MAEPVVQLGDRFGARRGTSEEAKIGRVPWFPTEMFNTSGSVFGDEDCC